MDRLVRRASNVPVLPFCAEWSLQIRMASSHEEIDPEKSENDREKPHNHHVSGPSTPPADGEPVMDENSVNDPCDQRPSLLGVPIPVGTPRHTGPDGPGNDSDSEKRETIRHAPVVYRIKGFKRRKSGRYGQEFLSLYAPLDQKIENGNKKAYQEYGISNKREYRMYGKPAAFKYHGQGPYFCRERHGRDQYDR